MVGGGVSRAAAQYNTRVESREQRVESPRLTVLCCPADVQHYHSLTRLVYLSTTVVIIENDDHDKQVHTLARRDISSTVVVSVGLFIRVNMR